MSEARVDPHAGKPPAPDRPREAMLCAWGITDDGRKVLLHLAPGTKGDTASCTAFFRPRHWTKVH
jgi:hypothetical protein